MNVKIKKLHKDAIIPTYGTESSAAVDLYAVEDYIFKPKGPVKWVRSGISIEMPSGYYAEVYNRSGLASKKELIILSSRVIDNDYRGELVIPMKLVADLSDGWGAVIKKGDRIAQMMIKKSIHISFEEVNKLSETDRGDGGFGSTGR